MRSTRGTSRNGGTYSHLGIFHLEPHYWGSCLRLGWLRLGFQGRWIRPWVNVCYRSAIKWTLVWNLAPSQQYTSRSHCSSGSPSWNRGLVWLPSSVSWDLSNSSHPSSLHRPSFQSHLPSRQRCGSNRGAAQSWTLFWRPKAAGSHSRKRLSEGLSLCTPVRYPGLVGCSCHRGLTRSNRSSASWSKMRGRQVWSLKTVWCLAWACSWSLGRIPFLRFLSCDWLLFRARKGVWIALGWTLSGQTGWVSKITSKRLLIRRQRREELNTYLS